jgi:hypothetical protein
MPDGSEKPKTPKRKKSCRRAVPREVKRAAKKLTRFHKTAFLDYFYTASAAGIEPFPVTPAKIEQAMEWVSQTAPTAARARATSWRNSTNALAETDRLALGLNENLPKPQAPRKLNAPAGTFPVLEDTLSVTCAAACRARTSSFDPQPADAVYCKGLARRLLVIATMLWHRDLIEKDIELRELVSEDNQKKFRSIADELARDTDSKICVSKDLNAMRFFAIRIGSGVW